jgi:hypothetical protein
MRRLVIVLGVLALGLAACGGGAGSAGSITTTTGAEATTTSGAGTTTSTPGESTTTTSPPETFVDVFFVKDGLYALPVTRSVLMPDVAAGAIEALIEGPTEAETESGLASAVPTETLLLGIDIDDRVATIDLSREFEQGGGSFGMFSRLAQVVYTLTQFDTVDEVAFRLDGEPVEVFSSEGIILEGNVTRDDYLSTLPLTPPAARWDQEALPSLDGVPLDEQGRVVLVAADDTLNVRTAAGVDHDVVGTLEPGVTVRLTGKTTTVGSSVWAEVVVPGGTGWVNRRFLGAVVTDEDFEDDARVEELLAKLAARFESGKDISDLVSVRGLYVSHHDAPVLFEREILPGIMGDDTGYRWPSNALGADSPELPVRTFAEAVGDRYVATFDDLDVQLAHDQPLTGGNGRIPEYALPLELAGFHYVAVHDPGDDAQYEGLDWTTWYISIDYEDGKPVVAGMTLDEWAP